MIGAVLLLHNLDVDYAGYFWPGLIILVGLYLIYRGAKRRSSETGKSQFRFIGDTIHSSFSGDIDGTDINHFIGDVNINLSGGVLKPGDNRMEVSIFIGDVEIYVPEGMEVAIHSAFFVGDVLFFDRKQGGLFVSFRDRTPGYDSAQRKLEISTAAFIGDIKIFRLKSSPA